MILTYKIKHDRSFSNELDKARKIAEYGIAHNVISSKDVKSFGLKSIISNQILRKYVRNKNCKKVSSIKLTIPSQGVKRKHNEIIISSLNLILPFNISCDKVNQVEIDLNYAYVSVTVKEPNLNIVSTWIGVDRNTTGHLAVVSNPSTGKTWKLGKKSNHTRIKYKNIRRKLQRKGKYKLLKRLGHRERNIIKNINHSISKKIITLALENKSGIKMENLFGIRNAKTSQSFRYSLNSWSFFELQNMIEYKARLLGVPVEYVDPRNTSKECSRCGLIGMRNNKDFKCPNGHVDNADVNASFNIALRHHKAFNRSNIDRDMLEGNSDIPKGATSRMATTS